MKKTIKGVRKTRGSYTLQKTKGKYTITSGDIKELAMQQEGNKILGVLDELSVVLRGEMESAKER